MWSHWEGCFGVRVEVGFFVFIYIIDITKFKYIYTHMYLYNLLPVSMQPVRVRYHPLTACIQCLGQKTLADTGPALKVWVKALSSAQPPQECSTFPSHSSYINRAKIRANDTSQAQHHPQGLSGFLAAGAEEGTAMVGDSDAGAPPSYQAAPNILHIPEPGLSESQGVFLAA